MWIKKSLEPHDCPLPSLWEGEPGSIWRCDECKARWIILFIRTRVWDGFGYDHNRKRLKWAKK